MQNKKQRSRKAPANNRKTTKQNKIDESAKNEIFGLLLMVVGIISFISIFSDKMGLLGQGIYHLLSIIGGTGNFILPLLFIFWGILYNIKSQQNHVKRYIISTMIIYLCCLICLDSSKDADITLIDRINLSSEYLSIIKSGGILGAILGFFAYKLLGSLGTYVCLSIIIFFSLYFMLRNNMNQLSLFGKNIYNRMKNQIAHKKLLRQEEKKEQKVVRQKKSTTAKKQKQEKSSLLDLDTTDNSEVFPVLKNEENLVIREYKQEVDVENTEKNNLNTQDDHTGLNIEEKQNEQRHVETDNFVKEQTAIVKDYVFPTSELMQRITSTNSISNQEIIAKGKMIEQTMQNFGIESRIIAINKGPVITCYELQPDPSVKLSKIVGLADNLAMALATSDIRIEAPIPGKSAVGIEVPNKIKEPVSLREMIDSKEFRRMKSTVPLSLGKDVEGHIMISSVEDMPHLLIAGATGSGKSVCINDIILNIIYKSSPTEVKLILVDPKVVELSIYNGIPHLLIPVVTNPKKAAFALNWAVEEMEKRYLSFAEYSVRDLNGYNNKMKKLHQEDKILPKIVIIVDELADLMMVASNEVEDAITRLAQKARAAGMHLILATQRPSVDVITGTIKANIPSRIAFAVSSAIDSRTILDMAGAEKLLGKGDMLFYPSNYSKPKRIQGAFVSDEEVERVVDFVKLNNSAQTETKYGQQIMEKIEKKSNSETENIDPLFRDALEYVLADEQASISYLQRKLKIGYSRAARIVDQMEEMGIIGPHEGSKPRSLLKEREEIEKLLGGEDE